MTTPEELRRLADALAKQWSQLDPVDEWRPDLEQAATALREYADSLELEPVAYMTEYFSPDCGPQYEIYKTDDMGWRDKSQYTPLYLHPPRSEPPKMTEADSRAEFDRITLPNFFKPAHELIEDHWQTWQEAWKAACYLRDKQWRGEE